MIESWLGNLTRIAAYGDSNMANYTNYFMKKIRVIRRIRSGAAANSR